MDDWTDWALAAVAAALGAVVVCCLVVIAVTAYQIVVFGVG